MVANNTLHFVVLISLFGSQVSSCLSVQPKVCLLFYRIRFTLPELKVSFTVLMISTSLDYIPVTGWSRACKYFLLLLEQSQWDWLPVFFPPNKCCYSYLQKCFGFPCIVYHWIPLVVVSRQKCFGFMRVSLIMSNCPHSVSSVQYSQTGCLSVCMCMSRGR